MIKPKLELWVEEKLEEFAGQKYRVEESLFSGQSPFQKVDMVRTSGFGNMLLLDGLVMLTERDEFVYHDMIAHVPLFTHPNPARALIIGGGDGGTAREVLRHDTVVYCRMIEIDGMVVEVAKQHLKQTSHALDDPRLNLTIEDGVKYLSETQEKYDVIIIDSTDPIGPAKPLFGEEFYANVHRALSDDGIVVAQGESPFYYVKEQQSIAQSMKAHFPIVHAYNYANLAYPGGFWTFMFASKNLCPLDDFDPARVERSGLRFSYYNAAVHKAAFALPQFQLEALEGTMTPFKG